MAPSLCQHCGGTHSPGRTHCPRTNASMHEPGLCGTQLDRYRIERLLGSGAFGSVYLARHARTQAMVALKVLKPELMTNATILERFLREATTAASVGSEHLVRVVDAEVTGDNVAFIAMEYLEGEDLKALLMREGRLHPARAVDLSCQVLRGLAAAHDKHIVHRDIKPANIFLSRRTDVHGRETELAKVLDFGISKVVGAVALTSAGSAIGTPRYMAWEQFTDSSAVDARTDLYAVASMTFELLTSRTPFDGEDMAQLINNVRIGEREELRVVAPGLPVPLCAVVEKGLERKRERRWQSARAFCSALEDVMFLLDPAPPLKPWVENVPTQKLDVQKVIDTVQRPASSQDAETLKG